MCIQACVWCMCVYIYTCIKKIILDWHLCYSLVLSNFLCWFNYKLIICRISAKSSFILFMQIQQLFTFPPFLLNSFITLFRKYDAFYGIYLIWLYYIILLIITRLIFIIMITIAKYFRVHFYVPVSVLSALHVHLIRSSNISRRYTLLFHQLSKS